ncbi:MAG: hypothetical protein RL732_1492 [Bacteroidota bacterium]|jgi:hypothetical protein
MKKVAVVKFSVMSILLSAAVLIACSKKASTSEVLSGSNGDVTAEGTSLSGNPHFLDCPTIELSGSQYYFSGAIVGLGNAIGSELKIVAHVQVDPSCINPSGKKVVPGQSKIFEKTITKTYTSDQNGRFDFNVSTFPIVPGDLGDVCPNGNWTLRLDVVTLLDYTFYIDNVEVRKTTGGATCY